MSYTPRDILNYVYENKLDSDFLLALANHVQNFSIGEITDKKIEKRGDDYLFEQKEAFVKTYSDVIKDAAEKYNIPPFLLAGIVYSEYGGDPLWVDNLAYSFRSFDWSGPDWMDENMTISKNPDLTSFGNVSMQVRRAAETLGYDIDTMTASEKKS